MVLRCGVPEGTIGNPLTSGTSGHPVPTQLTQTPRISSVVSRLSSWSSQSSVSLPWHHHWFQQDKVMTFQNAICGQCLKFNSQIQGPKTLWILMRDSKQAHSSTNELVVSTGGQHSSGSEFFPPSRLQMQVDLGRSRGGEGWKGTTLHDNPYNPLDYNDYKGVTW